MRRNEIEQYIIVQNAENTIESLTKEFETDEVIIYTLVTSQRGYIYPRSVNLFALKLSTKKDYWVCVAPTVGQVEVLEKDLPKLFKQAWNSNIENKGGYK